MPTKKIQTKKVPTPEECNAAAVRIRLAEIVAEARGAAREAARIARLAGEAKGAAGKLDEVAVENVLYGLIEGRMALWNKAMLGLESELARAEGAVAPDAAASPPGDAK